MYLQRVVVELRGDQVGRLATVPHAVLDRHVGMGVQPFRDPALILTVTAPDYEALILDFLGEKPVIDLAAQEGTEPWRQLVGRIRKQFDLAPHRWGYAQIILPRPAVAFDLPGDRSPFTQMAIPSPGTACPYCLHPDDHFPWCATLQQAIAQGDLRPLLP